MFTAIFINSEHHELHPSYLYPIRVNDSDGMAACLHVPYHPTLTCMDSLSTATTDFGNIDFWFAFRPGSGPRDVNRPATELLRFATGFTQRTVPLLRGRVLLTSHDDAGGVASLTPHQIRQVMLYANRRPRPLGVLDWRYFVDARAQRRYRAAARAAQERELWERMPNWDGS